MLVFEIGRDATQYSSSFESRISITYFSDLPPAARQRPVNQMSPRGDYHNVADMTVWGKILAKTHSPQIGKRLLDCWLSQKIIWSFLKGPLPIRPPANTYGIPLMEQVRKLYKKQRFEIKQRKYHLNLQESIYSYFASKKRFPMCPMKCPRPLPYFRLIVVHTRYLNIIYLWE